LDPEEKVIDKPEKPQDTSHVPNTEQEPPNRLPPSQPPHAATGANPDPEPTATEQKPADSTKEHQKEKRKSEKERDGKKDKEGNKDKQARVRVEEPATGDSKRKSEYVIVQ
jgi:hypothetical protein